MSIVIKEINYGIASRIGSTVYLHNGLKKYPELRDAFLQHEERHSSGFNFKDIIYDFGIKELKDLKKQYYTFILTHPSSWTEYLPICRYNNKWIFSPSIALIWIFAILVGWIVIRNI